MPDDIQLGTKQCSDDTLITLGDNWAQFKRDEQGKPYCVACMGTWSQHDITRAQIKWMKLNIPS